MIVLDGAITNFEHSHSVTVDLVEPFRCLKLLLASFFSLLPIDFCADLLPGGHVNDLIRALPIPPFPFLNRIQEKRRWSQE